MQRVALVLPREQIHLFLRGRRTLLLLPRSDGENCTVPPYKAGATIALQPAITKPATCRIAVRRVTDIGLSELGDDEARDLGHVDLEELMAWWVDRYSLWNENARAWLLRVEFDPSAPKRYLRPGPRNQREWALRSYTANPAAAMPGEPEALDDEALEAGRRAAHRTEHSAYEQLLGERKRMALLERLRLLEADAVGLARPLERDDIRALQRLLERMEQKLYRPADRATEYA